MKHMYGYTISYKRKRYLAKHVNMILMHDENDIYEFIV
jgi:hypothetical protein